MSSEKESLFENNATFASSNMASDAAQSNGVSTIYPTSMSSTTLVPPYHSQPLPAYQQTLQQTAVTIPMEAPKKDLVVVVDQRFSHKNTLFNILFIFCGGGLFIALFYFLVAFFMMLTIIGFPIAPSLMRNAIICLVPYGSDVSVKRSTNNKRLLAGNYIWCFFFGVLIAIFHLIYGIICFGSIVMIPFGIMHLKLAEHALFPLQEEQDQEHLPLFNQAAVIPQMTTNNVQLA